MSATYQNLRDTVKAIWRGIYCSHKGASCPCQDTRNASCKQADHIFEEYRKTRQNNSNICQKIIMEEIKQRLQE